MLFQQFVNEDLGCATYLVGCEASGQAVVIDPPYAVEPVLEAAAKHEVEIVRVIETHTHADHVSGHGRLALEHGIPVSIHPAAEVSYPHDPFPDGTEIAVGNVRVRCVHTPGHRPEHCCLTITDLTRADEPWIVLTGDSLFVGDTARPDLAVGGTEGATDLFHSLRRLLALSDGVEVFPGHVAGSLCGKGMSSKGSTTIGFERRFNPMLGFSDINAFVAESAGIGAPKPPNLARIVATNQGPFVGAPDMPSELASVPPDAQLLDVRPVPDFLAGHAHGAINVPVSGSAFSTKAGFVLDADRPVCVQAATQTEALRAVRGLQSVAFFNLPGYVIGAGSERVDGVSPEDVPALAAAGATIVDVRDLVEAADDPLTGALNVPYHLASTAELPSSGPIVTICATGPRAAIAASVFRSRGLDARPVVGGGVEAARATGQAALPTG